MTLLRKLRGLDLCTPLNFDVLNNAASLLIDDTILTTSSNSIFVQTCDNQKYMNLFTYKNIFKF